MAVVNYEHLPDDFFSSLLRERVRQNLIDMLMPIAQAEVEKAVDAAVASLEIDIRRVRETAGMGELFGVRVERIKRD